MIRFLIYFGKPIFFYFLSTILFGADTYCVGESSDENTKWGWESKVTTAIGTLVTGATFYSAMSIIPKNNEKIQQLAGNRSGLRGGSFFFTSVS